MRPPSRDINYLWRGARRLAKENPGTEVSAAFVSPTFALDGRRVQAEVVVIIRPVQEEAHATRDR